MKEDQTQLITARLEHLQFMMDNGRMPVFRHRSDMFLFALEAYNIARGLSSRYYRMQEDLDIRFFVRFRFDYWLQQIQQWIKQLGGAEYRVDDDNFFAEGRAKRLTVVVDRLFHYHEDRLPSDSADGSMPLPNEEILEPFRAILNMKSSDLVASFRSALQDVHKYLQQLSMLPVEWPEENRRRALQEYLRDAYQKEHVQTELRNYRYFCSMPDGKGSRGQFCYLKKRLQELGSNGELAPLSLAKSDQKILFEKLGKIFAPQEFCPSDDEIPSTFHPMANDMLFARLLYFVCLDGEQSFPMFDEDKVSNYITRKDVILTIEQEQNLQALFALMDAMRQYFTPLLEQRSQCSAIGGERQERINKVLKQVAHYNALLASLLDYNRETKELDAFFARLFSPEWMEDYGKPQDDLLRLFEKDRDAIQLKSYVRMLRVAADCLHIFKRTTAVGKKIYACLRNESIMADVTDENTIQTYYTKQGYGVNMEENWKQAIKLVDAVKTEYLKHES